MLHVTLNSSIWMSFYPWDTELILKKEGFSLNKERLLSSGISDLTRSLDLLKQSLLTHSHVTDIGSAAIDIIRSYTKSWLLLNAFDEDRLQYQKKPQSGDSANRRDRSSRNFRIEIQLNKAARGNPSLRK